MKHDISILERKDFSARVHVQCVSMCVRTCVCECARAMASEFTSHARVCVDSGQSEKGPKAHDYQIS